MHRLAGPATLALVLFAACGDPPAAGDDVADPDAGAPSLELLWDVDNLHGPIVAMALAGDGTAVLATDDGAVKQWSLGVSADQAPLEGGRPSYGEPLTQTGAVVRALAIGAGGDHVLGGDAAITVRRWALPGAEELGAVSLKGSPLVAIAPRSPAEAVIGDEAFGGQMRVVALDSGLAGSVFETALWGVTRLATHEGALFTTGHEYGMAAVERRDLAAPVAPVDYWGGLRISGWVRDLAVSPDGAWLALAGDEYVLVLAAGDLAAGPIAHLETTTPARAVAFTASGDHLAVATDDGRVALHTRDLAAEVASTAVPAPVALALDPSGERLIVASGDGRLRAFALR
jgi:hypothetical protein